MTELLSAAQMRAIEQAAIASGKVTGLDLMERAGAGVVEAVFEEWPEFREGPSHVTVLCGPGNNGGDGFVVARLLRALGWRVVVAFYGEAEKLPPDARVNHDRWLTMGTVRPMYEEGAGEDTDLLIDALFGIGLTRPLDDGLCEIFTLYERLRAMGGHMQFVAIDLPSGLDADTGLALNGDRPGAAFPSELTVTFHALKRAHRVKSARRYNGKVVVKDIGL